MAEAMPYKAALVRKKIAGLIPQKGGHMTQAKSIKASVGFRKLSAGDVLARANAILDGVYTAKDDYANPPVDQATLKTQIDALSAGITAAVGSGATPGNWTEQPVGNVKSPALVTGLSPGMAYAFQVRAVTNAGYTDWSESVTRICT